MGDFNITHFVNNDNKDTKTFYMNNFSNFFNLTQYNNILNDQGRLLDLVLSNTECEVMHDNAPLVREDVFHPALFVIPKINLKSKNFIHNVSHKAYNFRKANYLTLYNSLLDVNWEFLHSTSNINEACDKFYDKLYEMFDMHVPMYKNSKRKFPKWYNSDIILNIRKKSKHLEKYKLYKSGYDLEEFKRLRALIKQQVDLAYREYMLNVQSSIISDSQQFWSYAQSKKQYSRIPGKMSYENNEYNDPQSIVNAFSYFFSSVYTLSDNETPVNQEEVCNYNSLININSISECEILLAISKLKNKMTSGIDNIPSFIIKDCARILVVPLCFLFNQALQNNSFPDIWKICKICPIFKSGDPACISNYRAIAILSNFAKVFEIILYNRIYISVGNAITCSQHGFVRNRSTVTNLAVFTQYVSNIVDSSGQVDVVYTDFTKAFDSIDHAVLINKLRNFGFSISLLEMFKSYLQNRQQFVSYAGYTSEVFIATSGVPQGSNLGPLLFVLFINDLCSEIKCESLLYADDLKLFKSVNTPGDCTELQNCIQIVQSWCNLNKLTLNISKCKVMTISRKRNIYEYQYNINDTILSRCTSTKDLGVIFDSGLSFVEHINIKAAEAQKMLGFIIRNCKLFTNHNAIKVLYFSYVRSKLEYASLCWNPYYASHKYTLERVQRKFLKYLAFKTDSVYPDRGINHNSLLIRFNINSLEFRRICCALSFLHKLLHNQIDCPALLCQINFLVPLVDTRQSLTFNYNRARTNLMLKSPINFMCQNYNKICHVCDINHSTLNEILLRAQEYLS